MNVKASIVALPLLCVALTGCNVSSGHNSKAIRVEERDEREGRPQDIASETTVARLREDLRLASERIELAEGKAELEKQKREFAEERFRQLEAAGKAGDADNADDADDVKESSADEAISGS